MSVIPARVVTEGLAFATGQPAGKIPQTVGDGTFDFIDTPTGGGAGTVPHRVDLNVLPAQGATKNGQWVAEHVNARLLLSNNSTPADGDWIEWEILMAAGTWRFDALCLTAAGGAKVDVTLDGGAVLGTIDVYSAGTNEDVEKSITGITVAADGIYTLRLTVNGRNASSSNWIARFQLISLMRTGA